MTAGVEYFYVVTARDAAGNPSPRSNEASATPERTEAPTAPVILFPTDAAHPIERHAAETDVRGRAESGTVVTLTVNDEPRGSSPARPPFVADPLLDFESDPLQVVVSPDGRQVAHQIHDPVLASDPFRVEDVATALEKDVTASLHPSSVLLRFSPDGARLLYLEAGAPDDQKDLGFLDLESGETTAVEDGPESAYAAAWSADGTKIAYATAQGDACHLFYKDLGSGALEPLVAGAECPLDLRWSPDGTRLVFYAPTGSGPEVRLLTLGGGAPVVVAPSAYGARFAPDGRILYVDLEGGRIRSYEPDSGALRDLSDGTTAPFDLAIDPRGLWFSTLDTVPAGVRVTVTSLVSGERREVVETEESPRIHAWTQDGSLLLASAGGGVVTTHPGYASFALSDVALAPGSNRLVAQAQDPTSSLSSLPSEPVQVTVPTTIFPDPAVAAAETGSYPSSPLVGQPATLSARVRNLGGQDAEAVSVRLLLVDSLGAIVTESTVVLATLPAGE
ncbi:MAG TPA: hypothetical protein VIC87_05850, partial [Vicinamibacteria bacterium]